MGNLVERTTYTSYPNKQIKAQQTLNGSKFEYEYDVLGQLTSEKYTMPGESGMRSNYSYDSNGNRISRSTIGWPGMPAYTEYSYRDNVLTLVSRDGAVDRATVKEDGVTNFDRTLGTAYYDAVRQRSFSGPVNDTPARRYDYNHKNERTISRN